MSKELTPLQAFENIIETFWDRDTEDIKTVRNAFKETEKLRQINCELLEQKNSLREERDRYEKAVEIIKNKKVDVGLLLANSLDTYNQLIFVREKQLTQEEFDFLKGVFK